MVLNRIDQGLRVLDPYSHGIGFGFKSYSVVLQSFIYVTSRMTGRQDDGGPFDLGCSAMYGGDSLPFDLETCYPAIENDLPAAIRNGMPKRGDDPG